jgi:hypothetical protein
VTICLMLSGYLCSSGINLTNSAYVIVIEMESMMTIIIIIRGAGEDFSMTCFTN